VKTAIAAAKMRSRDDPAGSPCEAQRYTRPTKAISAGRASERISMVAMIPEGNAAPGASSVGRI
jgi:hypothetical protein